MWYDMDGNLIDVVQADRLLADPARQIAVTVFLEEEETVKISTVFLVLDHGLGQGIPVLWETMVFGGALDGEQDRYTSRKAALAGHEAMKALVLAALKEE